MTTGTLKVNGQVVESDPMPRSLPIATPWDETFNVGLDTGTPIDDQVPFRFTGPGAHQQSRFRGRLP